MHVGTGRALAGTCGPVPRETLWAFRSILMGFQMQSAGCLPPSTNLVLQREVEGGL